MQKNTEEGSERIVKAITVWQPWATLLATGQKHNETRSWKTSYRGEILIHAAKTDHSGILLHIPMEELKHFQDAGVVNKLPTGAIIGKVNLVDCFQIDEAYRRKLQRENPALRLYARTAKVQPLSIHTEKAGNYIRTVHGAGRN